jgi:voltage-gated potassium channel
MEGNAAGSLRERVYRIIFLSDTPAGRRFDVVLLYAILLSVVLVLMGSVASVGATRWGTHLRLLEGILGGLFSLEYMVRVWCTPQPRRYITSFFGVIDLLAVLPSLLGLVMPGAASLTVVRVLRITRVFRILNLLDYVREARLLLLALLASRHRIIVFMLAVLALVTVFGAVMYVVETPEAGFTSIPRSIYWAIVTLTTVGYGDIAPKTDLGQAIASAIMILGYAIIAIPTGIVSVEVARRSKGSDDRACDRCGHVEHRSDARFCHQCGDRLDH